MTLKSKVAIVTGGNSGIGQAIVLELAGRAQTSSSTTSLILTRRTALERQIAALGDRSHRCRRRRQQRQ